MLRSIFLAAFFLFLSSETALSQDSTNAYIDSLRIALMNSPEGEEKVNIYQLLSDVYLEIDYEEAMTYAELALDMAMGIDSETLELEAKLSIAHIYLAYELDYGQAIKYYNECLTKAEELSDIKSQIKIHQSLSYIYMSNGNFDVAKIENEKAMVFAEQLGEYPKISELNGYMGDLYEMSGDTASAIQYYEKVLNLEKENNFAESSNVSMTTIARYYYLTGDTEQALKYFRIALKRFQRINDQRWTAYTHSEMARVYVYEGNFERAELHALEGLDIAEKFKLRKELGDNYAVLAIIYDSLEQPDKSTEYLNAYNALQDSLTPIETAIQLTESDNGQGEVSERSEVNRFLQAIILTFPVILLLIFMGMPRKKL